MSRTSPDAGADTPRADVSPRRYSGRTRLAAATALALTGGLLVPGTSTAAVTVGSNISVFPNRDMVVAVGYRVGEQLTVDVLRNNVVVGTTTGPAVSTPEGVGLEVNHGPAADPEPGDCWTDYTPDIIAGDVIRITSPRGVDTMIVRPADFAGRPYADPVADEPFNVSIEGTGVEGTDILVEMRNDDVDPRFRPTADPIVWTSPTTWKATYRAQTAAERDLALNRATGWSGTVDNTLRETTLAELGEPGGVGPGCTGSADPNSLVGGLRPVNLASGDIELTGSARETVTAVTVTIGALGERTATLSTNPTGTKTWTLPVTKTDLMTLPDGNISVTPRFDGAAGATRTVLKDTSAPALPPTATPGAGRYTTTQSVSLLRPTGEPSTTTVHWEVGPNSATTPEPDAGSRVFSASSPQIVVSATQTIKARVYDAAGNPGPIGTFDYVVNNDVTPPPAPNFSLAAGTYNGTQRLGISNDEPGTTIRYNAGSAPTAPTSATSGTAYTGPMDLTASQTVVAVAFDAAGNASPATQRTYTIRQVPTVAPNVDPASGTYNSGQQLVMASPEAGVTLRFTTGTGTTVPADPTASSPQYTGPVSLTSSRIVKVAAFNAVGRGPITQRNYVINATTATAPTSVTAARGNGSATIRWVAPSNAAAAGVTAYRVRRYLGTGTTVQTTTQAASSATSLVVTGLTNGTNYGFDVTAMSGTRAGAVSSRVQVTPATTPGAPTIGTAAAGSATGAPINATARWTAPATGGSAITGYTVRAQRMSSTGTVLGTTTTSASATATSLVMTLPQTGNYRFAVRATTAVGTGAYSANSNQVAGR